MIETCHMHWIRRPFAMTCLLALCLAAPSRQARSAAAQDDGVQPALHAGLEATYTPLAHRPERNPSAPATRIDPDIQFVWDDASPDPRIPAGPFTARWRGKLFVPTTGSYTLHAHVRGRIDLQLGGNSLITGQAEELEWFSSDAVQLERGYHRLDVQFSKRGETARIGLYWRSNAFALEPIAPRWLFHDSDAAPSDEFQRGHELLRGYRCGACHALGVADSPLPAPSLSALAGNVDASWLVHWLQSPHSLRPDACMPDFALSADDAAAVAAYLLSGADADRSSASTRARKADARNGESLFATLGCLACHSLDGTGSTGLFGGGALDSAGWKRNAAALREWLANPEKLNADHRMPVFRLNRQETADLAAYLAQQTHGRKPAPAQPHPGLVNTGKKLIEQLRCAACHQIPDIAAPEPIALPGGPLRAACLDRPDRSRGQPGYNLGAKDRDALTHLVRVLPEQAASQSRFEHGRRLLAERNCIACHARDLADGLQPGGIQEAVEDDGLPVKQRGDLVPPSLTAVGDKFHDATLRALVQGGGEPYRPWLKVRMPRFNHTDREREALLAYLIGHDRIPNAPPPRRDAGATDGAVAANALADPAEVLLAGQRLVSSRGFGCMSCHTVGKHIPRGVDPSARGSDLLALERRIRHEWFLRWVRDPARIVPGMEMPAISVPIRDLLGGRIDTQIEALWRALNSASFVVPSSRDWVEQILTVGSDDRPVVLRDVMYDAPPGSGWCPRSLAVGLPNRHNVLFDLETLCLRAWWLGDFARERTEGKTWLWEPAGVSFWTDVPAYAGVALRERESGKWLLPVKEGQTVGWLEHWSTSEDAVQFSYRLRFENDVWLDVSETLAPTTGESTSGFTREVVVRGVPSGTTVCLTHSAAQAKPDENQLVQEGPLGRLAIEGPSEARWETVDFGAATEPSQRSFALALAGTASEFNGRLAYRSSARPGAAPPVLQVPTPAASRNPQRLRVVPGYEAVRLPLDPFVMPTAIAFLPDGTPVVCSLKGQVFLAQDTDDDGLEDTWQPFSDHLAAPFGVLTDGEGVIVSHKPELVRLEDGDGDGRADRNEVLATGWGYNDNYHDWTFGLVRDGRGRYYVALGSDYQQRGRAEESSFLRGHALRITPPSQAGRSRVATANIEDLASGLRFSAGIAINRDGAVFVTDNQGEQNTFNEINHILPGSRYGVPGLTDPPADEDPRTLRPPAIQVPHPLTRSVNGICFLEADGRFAGFEGHGIGCEYDTRALVRFSLQRVGDTYQGACYEFSLPEGSDAAAYFADLEAGADVGAQLLGPIACAVSPSGEIYVGGMRDSGWGGGNNVGELVRLVPKGPVPLGIREVRATGTGFTIAFTGAVDPAKARDPQAYLVSSYRRVWKGTYATPDSDRRTDAVTRADVAPDGRSVTLTLKELRPGFLYDLHVGPVGAHEKPLWPADAYYTMNVIP